MAKKIITVISDLSTYANKPSDGEYSTPEDENAQIPGAQSNEAPLRYFLKETSFSGEDDRILCLCTNEVNKPLSWAGEEYGRALSTIEFVEVRTRKYCQDHGYAFPPMEKIEFRFDEEDLEESLARIMRQIHSGDDIYIDTTGGPRSANFMNILLMQALEYRGCVVRDMIYAVYDRNKPKESRLVRLKDVRRVMKMTNAMAEFTTYGRVRLFEEIKDELDPESQDFVGILSEFSDILETSRFQEEDRKKFNKNLKEMNKKVRDMEKEDAKVLPLMKELLPVFQEELKFKDNKIDLASIVAWCAENHMLQQAVTIYNENLFETLKQPLGIIDIRQEISFTEDKKLIKVYPHQSISGLIVHKIAKVSHDYTSILCIDTSGVHSYLETTLPKRKYWLIAALDSPAYAPPNDEEREILSLLRCLFKNSVTARTREEAAEFACQNHLQALLPIIRASYTSKRQDGSVGFQETRLPEDVIDRLGEERYITALEDLKREKALSGIGDITKSIVEVFKHKDEIPQDMKTYLKRIDRCCHSILDYNRYISFADLGILMLEYQLLRLIRNQMNHSNSIDYNTSGSNLDSRVRRDLVALRLDSVIKDLKTDAIKEHLNIASGALRRLIDQAQAVKSLGLIDGGAERAKNKSNCSAKENAQKDTKSDGQTKHSKKTDTNRETRVKLSEKEKNNGSNIITNAL